MTSRDHTPSRTFRHSGTTVALLAAAAFALALQAQAAGQAKKPGQDPNSSQIILQHHHTHAATPDQGAQGSTDSKIILQRHPHPHDATPAGQDPATKKPHRKAG